MPHDDLREVYLIEAGESLLDVARACGMPPSAIPWLVAANPHLPVTHVEGLPVPRLREGDRLTLPISWRRTIAPPCLHQGAPGALSSNLPPCLHQETPGVLSLVSAALGDLSPSAPQSFWSSTPGQVLALSSLALLGALGASLLTGRPMAAGRRPNPLVDYDEPEEDPVESLVRSDERRLRQIDTRYDRLLGPVIARLRAYGTMRGGQTEAEIKDILRRGSGLRTFLDDHGDRDDLVAIDTAFREAHDLYRPFVQEAFAKTHAMREMKELSTLVASSAVRAEVEEMFGDLKASVGDVSRMADLAADVPYERRGSWLAQRVAKVLRTVYRERMEVALHLGADEYNRISQNRKAFDKDLPKLASAMRTMTKRIANLLEDRFGFEWRCVFHRDREIDQDGFMIVRTTLRATNEESCAVTAVFTCRKDPRAPTGTLHVAIEAEDNGKEEAKIVTTTWPADPRDLARSIAEKTRLRYAEETPVFVVIMPEQGGDYLVSTSQRLIAKEATRIAGGMDRVVGVSPARLDHLDEDSFTPAVKDMVRAALTAKPRAVVRVPRD